MANLNKQSVKKTGKARKELIVASLTERLDTSKGLVFTNYQGLSHKQLENLKKDIKKLDAKVVIAKNSLIKRALEKSPPKADQPMDEKLKEALTNPTAILFIEKDMMEPLKRLQKAIKEYGNKPVIKFGVLEGNILDEAGILKIASLPTREVLLAQLAVMLNSPIQGFTQGLNSIPQKFVMTLNTIASAKQSSQPTSAPAPEKKNEATPQEENETKQSQVDSSEATPQEKVKSEKLKVESKDENSDSNNENDKPDTNN